jgi:hypothetical protein
VVFRGYIDESYDNGQQLFALSCLIATAKHWLEMERLWKLHLAAKNKDLKKSGRPLISRYHASDCSGRRNEFKGWTHQERDAFVLGLFGIFKRIPVHVVAIDVNLDELCEVFPEWAADRLKTAYAVLTRFVMLTIGQDYDELSGGMSKQRGDKITLFHDRTAGGKYDATILEAFNCQMGDPDYKHKSYFTTIAPLGWEDCMALQPADLVAFEVFKEAEARAVARTRRKSFNALLDLNAFGIHTRAFHKEAMHTLRKFVDKNRVGSAASATTA